MAKTPEKKGTYCIYVPSTRVSEHKRVNVKGKVDAHKRKAHNLCQIRTRDNGPIKRVVTEWCACEGNKKKVKKVRGARTTGRKRR